MISKLGQVMVYVDDLDKAMRFWTEKAGFTLLVRGNVEEQNIRWFEVAPSEDSATSIVLHDKAVVAKMSPELDLATPSLMFYTDDVERLFSDFTNKGITTGELVDMGVGRSFNFSDDEGNFFAVMQPY